MDSIIAPASILARIIMSRPVRDHARDLQHSIGNLSRLRFTLAHENAHLLLDCPDPDPNYTASMALYERIRWLASAVWVDAALANTTPAFPSDWTTFSPRSGATSTVNETTVPARPLKHTVRSAALAALAAESLLLEFQAGVLPADSKAASLRLIDGILAALRLLFGLVLTALSQHLNVLTFVLVMLAVCLRYGRRAEPDDCAFLPMRRNLMSMGSCPRG